MILRARVHGYGQLGEIVLHVIVVGRSLAQVLIRRIHFARFRETADLSVNGANRRKERGSYVGDIRRSDPWNLRGALSYDLFNSRLVGDVLWFKTACSYNSQEFGSERVSERMRKRASRVEPVNE